MGHTSGIHCVGHPGGGYDDDDDVLIQLPDVAREAEKEEKKNSSKGTHKSHQSQGPGPKSQGQNEALVQGFPVPPTLGDGRKEEGTSDSPTVPKPEGPSEESGTCKSPVVPMPPPNFGDNDEDLGIRDIDAELQVAIEESRGVPCRGKVGCLDRVNCAGYSVMVYV